jgi:hypothetical protein
LADYPAVSPGRGRHLFGGDLVTDDVCAECNNGPLSELDEAAKRYWDAGLDSAAELRMSDRVPIARWAAKVSFNAQRAVSALGTAGEEPTMPATLAPWVLTGGALPTNLAMSIARMPTGHRDRDGAGTFGSNGTALPRRYVQLRGSVLLVGWDVPQVPRAAQQVADYDRRRMPAVDLLATTDPLAIPIIQDPDVVRRGFWRNEELLRRMAERYPPDPESD